MVNDDCQIEGKNAIYETMNASHSIKVLYVEKGNKDPKINEIINKLKEQKTVIKYLSKEELDKMSVSKKHQGIIAEILEFQYCSVDDILSEAINKGEKPFIVILDEIEDPHNFGAIIRTCVCAGVSGIIIKNRNQVQVTKTVIEVSSGATNYIKIARVVNISQTIKYLKEKGLFVYATTMEGENIYKTNLTGGIVLIVGNEGSGVSKLVKENADCLISIPQTGLIDSLNASVACGVAVYEIYRQRTK